MLQQLEQYNIHTKKAKCVFLCDAVEYLGYRIDADGLHTLSSIVKAIQDAPKPQKCARAEIVSGISSLLRQVFAKPGYIVTSPECSTQDWIKVVLVSSMLLSSQPHSRNEKLPVDDIADDIETLPALPTES